MKSALSGLLIVCSLVAFAGCNQKGGFEKAGERTDEVIDNIKDGDPPLHKKGTIEKAGEKVDEVIDKASE